MATMSDGELLKQLTHTLGVEVASALMGRLPPDGARPATHDDLVALGARIEARLESSEASLDARFESLEARMSAGFDRLEARIGEAKNEVLAASRGELIAAVTSQTRTMIRTMAGTVVALMGFAVALERLAG